MTCEVDLTAVIVSGSFNSMEQNWQPDGTCNVKIKTKDGKKYQANIAGLYTANMKVNTCAVTLPKTKVWTEK